jgi:hypothetical protein
MANDCSPLALDWPATMRIMRLGVDPAADWSSEASTTPTKTLAMNSRNHFDAGSPEQVNRKLTRPRQSAMQNPPFLAADVPLWTIRSFARMVGVVTSGRGGDNRR